MTQLYRHFDDQGRLLYVGISLSALCRLAEHRTVSHWFYQIARVDITQYSDRDSALIAERQAIRDENPLHNRQRDCDPDDVRRRTLSTPQNGRSNGLTDRAIRTSAPREKEYKLRDGNGLFLLVMPSGVKLWRLRYRLYGRECMISLGKYPFITLAMARDAAFEAKRLVAQGLSPIKARQDKKRTMQARNGRGWSISPDSQATVT